MINGFKYIYLENTFGPAFIISQIFYAVVFPFILNPFPVKEKGKWPRRILECLIGFVLISLLSCLVCGYYTKPYFQSVLTVLDIITLVYSAALVFYNVLFCHKDFVKQAIRALLFDSLFAVQSTLAGWFGTCQDDIWTLNTNVSLTLVFNIIGRAAITLFRLRFSIDKFIYVPFVRLILRVGIFSFTLFFISRMRLNFLKYALTHCSEIIFVLYSVLIVLSVIIYLRIYYNAKEYNERRLEQLVIDSNRGYIARRQRSEDKYNSVRKINHDVKNQFRRLKILSQEKKYDELEKYLNTYLSTRSEITLYSHCGNQVRDDILNILYNKCEKEKVSLNSKVLIPSSLKIEPIDLCAILTNLADNAIHSLKEQEDKRINLSITYINQSLLITRNNPTAKNFKEKNLDRLIHRPSKSDYHGYGLKIVDGIAKTYSGSLKLSCQDNVFTADVLLFDGEKKKNGK